MDGIFFKLSPLIYSKNKYMYVIKYFVIIYYNEYVLLHNVRPDLKFEMIIFNKKL